MDERQGSSGLFIGLAILVALVILVPYLASPNRDRERSLNDLWRNPISGEEISTVASADLAFTPIEPSEALGGPIAIMANHRGPEAGRRIAWVYRHPIYGPFAVLQGPVMSEPDAQEFIEQLSAWPIPIRPGISGALRHGPNTVFVYWIEPVVVNDSPDVPRNPHLIVHVIGSAGELRADHAVEIARMV